MRHDELCELGRQYYDTPGPRCHCASRAYARNPVPPDLLPLDLESELYQIWPEQAE